MWWSRCLGVGLRRRLWGYPNTAKRSGPRHAKKMPCNADSQISVLPVTSCYLRALAEWSPPGVRRAKEGTRRPREGATAFEAA
jgi:hypothetical protein